MERALYITLGQRAARAGPAIADSITMAHEGALTVAARPTVGCS